jgi:hypothetical protein
MNVKKKFTIHLNNIMKYSTVKCYGIRVVLDFYIICEILVLITQHTDALLYPVFYQTYR